MTRVNLALALAFLLSLSIMFGFALSAASGDTGISAAGAQAPNASGSEAIEPAKAVAKKPVRKLPSRRPNVLVILTDDQAPQNFTRRLMPNVFGQLVDRGVHFKRAYNETPLCCPSRSQLLTGLYAHHTGIDTNSEALAPNRPTIAQALQSAGYRTLLAGKYLNADTCDPHPGWTRWACYGTSPSRYSLRDPQVNVDGKWKQRRGYTTDILAEQMTEFIRETPASTPFFAFFTPTSPHLPADDPRGNSVAVEPYRPPSYDEDTTATGKPKHMRRPPLTQYERSQFDRTHLLMTRALKPLDASIGRILKALGPRERDTVVVFMSDNGYLYGEHRVTEKVYPYEESVRTPLVIRYPALVSEKQAFETTALVENVDVTATIAALARLPWNADGRSFVPVLTGRSASTRDAVLIEHCKISPEPCNPNGNPPTVPSYFGVVTSRYKYVDYVSGDKELYDLAADPFELKNLAGAESHRAVRDGLRGQLDAMLAFDDSPPTTIASGPRGLSSTRTPSFDFFTPELASSLDCRLLGKNRSPRWSSCVSGRSWGPLPDGDYRLEVRATDARGRETARPAARKFSIRMSGPRVQVRSGPADPTSETSATFAFASPVAGTTFQCRLGRGRQPAAWRACTGGRVNYASLEDGHYTFEVRARDRAGRVTSPAAYWFFRVGALGPEAFFDQTPPAYTVERSARFRFQLSAPATGAVLCSLDGGVPSDCSNGKAEFTNLPEGKHRLVVAATGQVGPRRETAYEFNVDTTRPKAAALAVGPGAFTIGADGDAGRVKFQGRFNEPITIFVRVKTLGGLVVWRYSTWKPDEAFEAVWDGSDTMDARVPAGTYDYAVLATDRAGNTKRYPGTIVVR